MNLSQTFTRLSRLKKVIIFVVVLALLGFGGYKVFGQQEEKPTYQTAQAEKGTLITSVTASGTISSASSASINSSATGIVKEVYVTNGDIVEEGQKIAEITLDKSSQQQATSAYANYLSAQNALNTANAKMNSLQSALFTANQKFVNGAGTADPIKDDPTYIIQRADWLQAESDYNNQKGVIAQTNAALSSASLSYAETSGTVTAPMAGKISNLTITQGQAISSSSNSSDTSNSTSNASNSQSFGAVVLENGQTQASINLSEIDITKVEVGQKVTITMDAFPDKSFTGKVSAIDTNGSVSSGVTMYPVTITFDSSLPNMYPNMAVSAAIITNIKDNVLLVPSAAVQTTNGTSTIQIMKDGEVTRVSVEIGDSNDTQTEIVSGINEGDNVVTSTITKTSSQSNSASPFGSTGAGGARSFSTGGFGGGGNAVRIQMK
jgi:macrolide-specific efflux system membrane fusion protein